MSEAESVPAARRIVALWRLRAVDAVSAYLPLLLMAALALGTWWLVQNTPLFENSNKTAPVRHEPDYTMTRFTIQRFAPDGTMRAQIEGNVLRHYPDNDTFEIDDPRILVIAVDGRVTHASAQHAISNRDGSEAQLIGDAHVVREAAGDEQAIDFRSQFLQYFQSSERVQTHLPVVVTQGGSQVTADAMAYDNLARRMDLKGQVRGVLDPPNAKKP